MSTSGPIGGARPPEPADFDLRKEVQSIKDQKLKPELPKSGGDSVKKMEGVQETLQALGYVPDAVKKRAKDLGDNPDALVFWSLTPGIAHAIILGIWGGKK